MEIIVNSAKTIFSWGRADYWGLAGQPLRSTDARPQSRTRRSRQTEPLGNSRWSLRPPWVGHARAERPPPGMRSGPAACGRAYVGLRLRYQSAAWVVPTPAAVLHEGAAVLLRTRVGRRRWLVETPHPRHIRRPLDMAARSGFFSPVETRTRAWECLALCTTGALPSVQLPPAAGACV